MQIMLLKKPRNFLLRLLKYVGRTLMSVSAPVTERKNNLGRRFLLTYVSLEEWTIELSPPLRTVTIDLER